MAGDAGDRAGHLADSALTHPLRALIRRFDDWLSRVEGVEAFSQDPRLIMRIQTGRPGWDLPLTEGLIAGDAPVLFVHLWNERMPVIPPQGPDLTWALQTQRAVLYSFRAIAGHIKETPALQAVQAVGGIIAQIHLQGADGGRTFLEGLGFTIFGYHRPGGAFGEFWENFYTWGLMWTFNPASLRGRSLFTLQRNEFWMTKEKFLERFEKM